MNVSVWREAIAASIYNLWNKVVTFVPELITAILILIIGLLFASFMGGVARRLMKMTHIDALADKTGVTEMTRRTGFNFTFSGIIGWAVKWFFILVILIAVADTLGWDELNGFLNRIVLYIPNVIIAVLILAIGLIAGQFVNTVVDKSLTLSQLGVAQVGFLGGLARWAIIIFALMAGLVQLGIAPALIEILFGGIVLAFALAFGLGGRDKAAELIERVTQMVSNRKR